MRTISHESAKDQSSTNNSTEHWHLFILTHGHHYKNLNGQPHTFSLTYLIALSQPDNNHRHTMWSLRGTRNTAITAVYVPLIETLKCNTNGPFSKFCPEPENISLYVLKLYFPLEINNSDQTVANQDSNHWEVNLVRHIYKTMGSFRCLSSSNKKWYGPALCASLWLRRDRCVLGPKIQLQITTRHTPSRHPDTETSKIQHSRHTTFQKKLTLQPSRHTTAQPFTQHVQHTTA